MTKIDPQLAKRIIRKHVFPKVGYKPHPSQKRIHNSPARHRVVSCGRRFGKSTVGGMELVVEAYLTQLVLNHLKKTGKRREFWIVGPNYTDAAKEFRVAYNALEMMQAPFDHPGTYNNERDGNMQISLYGGKYLVKAMSAQHPERLVGEGLAGVIMAEAAKQKESTWSKYVRPALADFRGWSLFPSTPEGKNWFYDLWMDGQSEDDNGWASWRMPSWRNPYVYRKRTEDADIKAVMEILSTKGATVPGNLRSRIDDEIWAQMNDLTPETFNQENAALFTEFVGRVFKEFDEELHVKDFKWNPDWPTYAAVDYGFTNPFVWLTLQVNPVDESVWVTDEMYETNMTIDEIANEIKTRELVKPGLKFLYPDPASPGDTRTLETKLGLMSQAGTGGEIKFRLRAIRAALKERNTHLAPSNPGRRPRLLVNRICTNTIREFNDYRYPKTYTESNSNPPEIPLKKDDHTVEALGRFFGAYFNAPEETQGGSRVSEAQYTR